MVGFRPDPIAVAEAVAQLRERRYGGVKTPDNMRLIAHRRQWEEMPIVGDFTPSNSFLFWQAAYDTID